MSAAACPEDLLVLARRGPLSAGERRLLEAHAADCALCRMALSLGAALAPLSGDDQEEDGDDAMAARLIARTLAPRLARPGRDAGSGTPPAPESRGDRTRLSSRARRPHRWAVAAALVLMGGSASAAFWQWSPWRPAWLMGPKEVAPAAETHRPSGGRRHPGPGVSAPTPPAPSAEPPAPAEAPAPPALAPVLTPARMPVSAPIAPSAATTPRLPISPVTAAAHGGVSAGPRAPESAAALFRAANEARRARQFPEARRLYRALQGGFPGSPEAALSFLSLGDLCLARGAFTEALEQFDAYLRSGDSALAEEALVGRARTLARLGRSADERAAWKRLLATYPESDYRWRAQQRLDAQGN